MADIPPPPQNNYRFESVNQVKTGATKKRVSAAETKHNTQQHNRARACNILIINKGVDVHYEILESVALRYPLPWHMLNNTKNCQYSGLNYTDPIHVDFLLSFAFRPTTDNHKMEGWGWKKYFDQRLQGTIRQRRAREDARYIHFRSIVGIDLENDPPNYMSYSAHIDATCDSTIRAAIKWMHVDKRNHRFCVLHGVNSWFSRELASKICYLNPQHHPNCWFLPVDYPIFPSNYNTTITTSNNNNTNETSALSTNNQQSPPSPHVNVCIPDKKDASLLAQALRFLRPSNNVRIVLHGRKAKLPNEFADLSHYVTIRRNMHDFLDFQRSMAQCHIMIPLLEPAGSTVQYFVGNSSKHQGRLSGYVAQLIGYRIPSVLHSSVIQIYRNELTARYYEYNSTTNSRSSSFTSAFQAALESYGIYSII